jgi:phytoene dehydrogenase-like protein
VFIAVENLIDDQRRVNAFGLLGACTLGQLHLWRPLPGSRNNRTFVRGLYHIGASTHPGAGLGGMSGYLAAQDIR